MKKRAFIFAAGVYTDDDLYFIKRIKMSDEDVVICADGGYKAAKILFKKPNVYIGDRDSYSGPVDKEVLTFIHPVQKDKTDLHLSIDYALEQGCDEIILLGVTGGRADHTLNAFNMLGYIASNGADGVILSCKRRIYLVKDKIKLPKDKFTKISIIPMTIKAEGVSTRGLLYPLENASLSMFDSLGMSNEFVDDYAEITLKKGAVYVICEEEK